MAEGKPYRYGLIVAGLSVVAAGLFLMTQERPHIYATLCSLGICMVCVGTAWSLCHCYPKVVVAPEIQKESLEEVTEGNNERRNEALPASCGQMSSRLLSQAPKSQRHSCPTLQLV